MDQESLEATALSTGKAFSLVLEKLNLWLEDGITLLPNLVVALIVVLLAALVARLVRKMVRRVLDRTVKTPTIARLCSTVAHIVVLLLGVFVALEVLHLEKAVTSLLAGAGVIGLALAFAFQDLAGNLVAGVYLSVKRPMAVGDMVETNGVFGRVKFIDLRNTTMETPEGDRVIVPNRMVFEDVLKNVSTLGVHRMDLECGVSYASDLERVREVTLDAVKDVPGRVDERGTDFFYTGFGGSSIDFVVRFWVPYSGQASLHGARTEAMIAIKKAFDAEGIGIPFPITTLDFGIEGGEHLRDAWPQANAA